MNRLVLIGNGFDLAHNLKTRYENFINWYWVEWGNRLMRTSDSIISDEFCKFALKDSHIKNWYMVRSWHYKKLSMDAKEFIQKVKMDTALCDFEYKSYFFEIINNCINTKGWVDIENEYYLLLKEYALGKHSKRDVLKLNNHLIFLKCKLIEYLNEINKQEIKTIDDIREKIYAPINSSDVAVEAKDVLKDYMNWCSEQKDEVWEKKLSKYGIDIHNNPNYFYEIKEYRQNTFLHGDYPRAFRLPDNIMLLNFNYTNTACQYLPQKNDIFSLNHIHGELDNPQSVIFGYGDELDEDYKAIKNINDNDYLENVKSIRYLESCNYRRMLSFIDSAPFQVCIMGHSCGNSDRTLLNTIFEHQNCVSIKPYYYIDENWKDNYLELAQNISRNFTDMKLLRDRVVNKTYCEPLVNKH